jgi:hypothetical protein
VAQVEVEHHHTRLELARLGQHRVGRQRRRHLHLHALGLKVDGQQLADDRMVVDQQDAHGSNSLDFTHFGDAEARPDVVP